MLEEIGEPVPAAGGFDDGFVGSGELGEVSLASCRFGGACRRRFLASGNVLFGPGTDSGHNKQIHSDKGLRFSGLVFENFYRFFWSIQLSALLPFAGDLGR